jgi:DNA-binding MarR family transcriptional regulator
MSESGAARQRQPEPARRRPRPAPRSRTEPGLAEPASSAEPAGPTKQTEPTEQAEQAEQAEHGQWWPLAQLQAAMDAEIARIYTDRQISGLKPSFVLELLRLHERGPMTITELAESVQRTHSAVSQKVAAMRAAGLVKTSPGTDARSKKVALTPKSRRIVGLLAAEWRATEAAIAELEAEIPYPLSRVVTDLERALERKSFHARITEKLTADPHWHP